MVTRRFALLNGLVQDLVVHVAHGHSRDGLLVETLGYS